jgi:hypothetical protein
LGLIFLEELASEGVKRNDMKILLAEWLEVGTVWQNKQFETLGF